MRLVRYHDGTGYRAALIVNEGPKYLHIITIDVPITVRRVPVTEGRFMRDIEYTGRKRHVANAFKAAGKDLGITKGALRALATQGK